MNTRSLIFTFLCLIGVGTSLGIATASATTIDKMMMDENYGEKLFIKGSTTATDRPACSIHPVWDYVLDTSTILGMQIYAILVKQYADQTPISLHGKGSCDLFSGIETLRRIDLP